MPPATFAERLATAVAAERAALLASHEGDLRALAHELRQLYFDSYSSAPQLAAQAAEALAALAAQTPDPEVMAVATWVEGLAELQIEGRVERAVERINQAEARFLAIGRAHEAATTQVSKVFALAVLGRYDEAIACGLRARDALLAHDDPVAAGRVELNLGNLYNRRDQYAEAERYYRAARARFTATGERRMLPYVDNGLANMLSQQHRFHDAAELYEQALAAAVEFGLEVTQAEIECNLGGLALFQGRYDQALSYLEQSRRRYAALEMPHESAIAELELADAYMELNMAAEAAAIYSEVSGTFAALAMRAEQARALLNHGRACLQLGRLDEAWALTGEAEALFADEGNSVGTAMATVVEAQLCFLEGDYGGVAAAARRAAPPLEAAGVWGQLLILNWLAAEAARAAGDLDRARALLEPTLAAAEERGVAPIAQRCHTSLGHLALSAGDREGAEARFQRAIAIGEELRTPLPADEVRAAFAAGTLTPYAELVRLCLSDPRGPRVVEALAHAEAGRGRAMIEMLGSAVRLPAPANSGLDPVLLARLAELRTELNWLYSRIGRPPTGEAPYGPATLDALHQAAHQRELALAEVRRRLRYTGDSPLLHVQPFDLAPLQAALGHETALVEYVELAGELAAFVVTDAGVEIVHGLGSLAAVELSLSRLHFQIGAMSHGAGGLRNHLAILAARARRHLQDLYELLLRPIEPLLGARRLAVVPHRALYYVPFHALHDGDAYLIERREVCAAPSADVLRYCLERPRGPLRRALIVGVADEWAPRAREEALALAGGFPETELLIDGDATLGAVAGAAPSADLLHLACHGRFRPDSPLFSALHLADGWLTVHDTYSLNLRCQLVTLSACETGVSAIAPGDELLGLARGFFLAGAPALLVSLWRVDDEATAALMAAFYASLQDGATTSAALRHAQLSTLERAPHPFFWASFALLGRW
jgi:tetratricopeptide (TPR) repeat protein